MLEVIANSGLELNAARAAFSNEAIDKRATRLLCRIKGFGKKVFKIENLYPFVLEHRRVSMMLPKSLFKIK